MCCRVHLWTVILLYLLLWSAVVSVWCSLSISTSYRGALLFLYAVWWDGQKLISFLCSGGHRMEYCSLCCVFSGAVLCCLCCLLWKCVKYQDRWETYPRVVYISVERSCVRMGWMYSIFTIRIKFEIIERLLQSYYLIINIFIWEVSSTISKK